jgi:Spy/CpxP family protein refolding chaperone
MRNYATATALALITMLTLAVSASLMPANATHVCARSADQATAWAHMFGVSPSLMLESFCMCQCQRDAMRRFHTETQTSNAEKSSACSAKCVNEFEARRR